jgi:acetyl-CoA acetyltransferase
MSESRAKALGLRPRARFVAFDVIGDDPSLMLTAPIPATKRVLHKANLESRRHRPFRGERGIRFGPAGLAA